MAWTPDQVQRHKAAAKAVADINHSTEAAVDNFCDSVETLLTAIAQRPMTSEQVDRLAGILQRAERNLLARCTTLAATARPLRRAAASRSSSGKGEAA